MSGRVLVTGASGMLGSAVADLLEHRGWDVTTMQRRTAGGRHREILGDVCDPAAVSRAVRGQDAVVHLAAKVNVTGAWKDYVRVNVGGTRAVVDAGWYEYSTQVGQTGTSVSPVQPLTYFSTHRSSRLVPSPIQNRSSSSVCTTTSCETGVPTRCRTTRCGRHASSTVT